MATTGDQVRARCIVTPVEECDEGFTHIQSDIAKRLGDSFLYELTDTNAGDKFYYDESYTIGTSELSVVPQGSTDYCDGSTYDATNDLIKVLYIQNNSSSGTLFFGVNGDTLGTIIDRMFISAGESCLVKINSSVAGGRPYVKADKASTDISVFAIINDAS